MTRAVISPRPRETVPFARAFRKRNSAAQGSHIKIDAVPEELKIPREAYRVIMLMPLVYVAWADRKIQGQERKLITTIAEEHGLLDHGGRGCLERWLVHAPSVEQLRSHLAILSELARSHGNMGGDFDADTEQLIVAWCQDVADAAGGLLGLRSPRKEAEHAALKTIAAAVDVRNAKHWRALLATSPGA